MTHSSFTTRRRTGNSARVNSAGISNSRTSRSDMWVAGAPKTGHSCCYSCHSRDTSGSSSSTREGPLWSCIEPQTLRVFCDQLRRFRTACFQLLTERPTLMLDDWREHGFGKSCCQFHDVERLRGHYACSGESGDSNAIFLSHESARPLPSPSLSDMSPRCADAQVSGASVTGGDTE